MSHCLSTLQAPSILTKKFDTKYYYIRQRGWSLSQENTAPHHIEAKLVVLYRQMTGWQIARDRFQKTGSL